MRFDDTTAVVTGIGSCLPDRAVTNDEVIADGHLDTTDGWLRTRTGIARRHRAGAATSTGDLAVAAGRAALESDGGRPPDLLLLATSTPDHPCPATAPDVAHRLGLGTIGAYDLAAVCSGFLYAMATATALLRGGLSPSALVIGADTYSTIIDPHDRDTAALFGDGAGAVVLRPGPAHTPGAIRAAHLGSDGSEHPLITIPGGGSRHPHPLPQPTTDHYFHMHGREVYAHAVRRMTQSARTCLDHADWPVESLGAFIGHQANQRILDSVAQRLGIPPENRFGTIHETGNTAAASIPLVMAAAAPHTSLAPGDRTLLTAFGGGLTWASIALTWPTAAPLTHPEQSGEPAESPTRE
ncbi:beta-ketoacyl-ACP synthase III [Streptomyces mauvecolor]|uniref:Beta-ketoacyl-ACP synthase III n=1 Tax=Streptomyces mauvecolor TaxID=58345 RepID=A0ABV9UZ39_9ACTN